MTGVELIAAERQRQIEVEGYTPEHDAEHDDIELAKAAWCYLFAYRKTSQGSGPALPLLVASREWPDAPMGWPWWEDGDPFSKPIGWKPGPTQLRNLVRAGALVAAEIDRLQSRQQAERDEGITS